MARLGRIVRRLAIVLVLAGVGAILTLTQSAPNVAGPPPPDAVMVAAGRDALLQLRGVGLPDDRPVTVMIDPLRRDGLVALANQALQPVRVSATQNGEALTLSFSKPLPLGRWLNVTADMAGESKAFPPVQLAIGHISLSPTVSRWLIDRAVDYGVTRGIALPPLDRLVSHIAITPAGVSATLQRPSSETGLAGLAALSGIAVTPPDPALIGISYCKLASAQRAQPSADFATQVRRAFAGQRSGNLADQNRAAFIALAMFAADSSINQLAGDAQAAIKKCQIVSPALMLWGRSDLPRHWALSAGLSARLGAQMAGQMGEWKELLDSLPLGSGFSFVDLAANRSGFRFASAGSSDETASAIRNRLSKARAQDLLPSPLLKAPEQLSQKEWEARFTNTDAVKYQAAIAAIDRQLNAVIK